MQIVTYSGGLMEEFNGVMMTKHNFNAEKELVYKMKYK